MISTHKELMTMLNKIGKTWDDVKLFHIQVERSDARFVEKDYTKVNAFGTSREEMPNFLYDNGFGDQIVYGEVLFNDNTWLERRGYDGKEWWHWCTPPVASMVSAALKVVKEFDQPLQISEWTWFMGDRNLIANTVMEYYEGQLLKVKNTTGDSYLGKVMKARLSIVDGEQICTVVLRRIL